MNLKVAPYVVFAMGIFCNGAVTWIYLIGFPIASHIFEPSLHLERTSKQIR